MKTKFIRTNLLLAFTILVSPFTLKSEEVNLTPVVENITASQITGTKQLQIFYDLSVADDHTCIITVQWSTDNGETFPITAVSLTGEAGPGIEPGSGKMITWDMGVDWNNQFTQKGRIQITANREPIGDNAD